MAEKEARKKKKITITLDIETYKKLAHKKISREDKSLSETIEFLMKRDC